MHMEELGETERNFSRSTPDSRNIITFSEIWW